MFRLHVVTQTGLSSQHLATDSARKRSSIIIWFFLPLSSRLETVDLPLMVKHVIPARERLVTEFARKPPIVVWLDPSNSFVPFLPVRVFFLAVRVKFVCCVIILVADLTDDVTTCYLKIEKYALSFMVVKESITL